jgi:hypothetical protein
LVNSNPLQRVSFCRLPDIGIHFLFWLGTLAPETHFKNMDRCTYSVTDLTSYESSPFEIALDTDRAAQFAARMARELLVAMPYLRLQGLCIAVYNANGDPISIIPLDPVQ